MTSNCSVHRLRPLDPAIDPAYQDGAPPRPHRPKLRGEIRTELPVALIPPPLGRFHTISLEALEAELEREAIREERSSG